MSQIHFYIVSTGWNISLPDTKNEEHLAWNVKKNDGSQAEG